MQAAVDSPPLSPQPPKRQIFRRGKGEQACNKFPLPGAGEQRYHLTRLALRWALYGNAPLKERTIDATANKFGIDRGTLQQAWEQDGVEAKQAELLGVVPFVGGQIDTKCQAMGSLAAGRMEGREREKQLDILRTRRSTVTQSLDSLPSRLQHLNSLPLDPAVSQAIDSANREAAKLVTELKVLNGMIAEATGLDVIQSLSLAAAKAQALKPQAPKEQERETRGVVVEL